MCVFVSTCSLVLYMLTMTFAATSYAKSPSTVVWIWAKTLIRLFPSYPLQPILYTVATVTFEMYK